MINMTSLPLAAMLMRTDHLGGPSDAAETALLLVGLVFAGILVWTIQRSGRRTTLNVFSKSPSDR